MKALWTALAAVVTVTACAAADPRVALDATWPTQAPNYDATYQAWTRHGELHQDYQEVIAVDATLYAPAWRAALADRARRSNEASEADFGKAVAAAQADAAAHIKVSLVVTTWDRRENNLARGAQAAWQLQLVDDAGHLWSPTAVVQDRRSEHVLRAEHPTLRDFSSVYTATFDATTPLFGNGAKQVTLRVFGPRGKVALVWRAP